MSFDRRKKTISIATLSLLVLIGTASGTNSVQAAAAFNTFPVAYSATENHDFPLIDARNVTKNGNFSSSQSDHNNGVQADPGDEIEIQIYYHNSAADTSENIAHNVIVKANLPGDERSTHEISATIDSDETSPVSSSDQSRGGNMQIHLSESQELVFVSGSTRHFPNRSQSGQSISGGNNIAGSGVNVGDVRGCFEFSGFVNFKVRVARDEQPPTENRNLSITKRVRNVTDGETGFRGSTNADAGDRVEFEIRFSTSGDASQNNVIARDLLPTRLNRVSGTFRVDGSTVSGENDFFGSGRNFGTLSAGTNRTITFEATAAAAGSFSDTVTTLTNTANIRSDQVGTRQDSANVLVSAVSGIQFEQRKTAFNLTQGINATTVSANPGDVIVYSLFVRNTGQTTIKSFRIEDDIHDITELALVTNQGGATAVNSVIRWEPVDIPSGVEIVRTFQVTIRPQSEFPAASDLVMTNIFGNVIKVPVRKISGVTTPPRTGAGEWIAVGASIMATAGYWIYRRKREEAEGELT